MCRRRRRRKRRGGFVRRIGGRVIGIFGGGGVVAAGLRGENAGKFGPSAAVMAPQFYCNFAQNNPFLAG